MQCFIIINIEKMGKLLCPNFAEGNITLVLDIGKFVEKLTIRKEQ